jgi:hypothetical protein
VIEYGGRNAETGTLGNDNGFSIHLRDAIIQVLTLFHRRVIDRSLLLGLTNGFALIVNRY